MIKILMLLSIVVLIAGTLSTSVYAQGREDGKNIQVLKGVSVGERDKIMDFVAASLGVKCGHCHVIDSTGWHMELDEKPTKRTARKMMQMVMNINKENFGGRSEVSCYTCHHGSTEPVAVLPLPVAQQGPPPGPPREPQAEAPLPGVDQVLAMTEKALGGEDAMKKISSRVSKGVLVTGDGREMPLEITAKAPDKFISTTTMKDGATSSRAYNGKAGWSSSPRGTREMSPEQSEDMKQSASLFPMSRLRQLSKTMHVSKKDSVNGSAVYVLEAQAGEHTIERYYVDAESGLLLRKVLLTETMLADIPEQTDFADYRAVDGVKVPFMIRSSSANPRDAVTRKLTTVEQNVPVDAKKFEMPAKSK